LIIALISTDKLVRLVSWFCDFESRAVCCCRSQDWKCEHCGCIRSLVRPVTEASQALSKEAKELGSQIKLQVSIPTVLILPSNHQLITQ